MDRKTIGVLVLVGVWLLLTNTFEWGAGYDKNVFVHKEPLQSALEKAPFVHKGFTIHPIAHFDIEARLLSKRRYFFGNSAKLSPFDYALGWGPMSFHSVLKKMNIFQFGRWYHYRYKEPPILESQIVASSANMHLIPATKQIAKKIKRVRKGKIVKMKGYLVNVTKDNGWHWNTSLRRTDTGAGSCEIFWVEDLEVR